jgi:hypothetical protein
VIVSGAGGDSLTRTTLQVSQSISIAAIGDVVRALQRVPGVLLADLNPSSARVTVAHDGAVLTSALVSAAKGAGAHATIVSEARPAPPAAAATAASLPAHAVPRPHVRASLIAMSTIAVVLIGIDALLPDSPQKRLVLNGLVLAVWICFFAGLFVRRNP